MQEASPSYRTLYFHLNSYLEYKIHYIDDLLTLVVKKWIGYKVIYPQTASYCVLKLMPPNSQPSSLVSTAK
jgi:hypothetical protein